MTDESEMTFGKHKGIKLANIPADYLIWLYENVQLDNDLKAYIKDNEAGLRKEIEREPKKTHRWR